MKRTKRDIPPWAACADLKAKVADYDLTEKGREITDLLIEWEIVRRHLLPHEQRNWVHRLAREEDK